MDSYELDEYNNVKLLDHIETKKIESLDTLVYTSSLFVIPINIAALNNKLLLMNLYIFLAVTSWAHHACRHMQVKNHCIYDEIDKLACITLSVFIFLYTLFYTTFRKFIITFCGMICIAVCFSRVYKNREIAIKNRGIHNWKYHKPHIIMHLTAALIGTYVALPF